MFTLVAKRYAKSWRLAAALDIPSIRAHILAGTAIGRITGLDDLNAAVSKKLIVLADTQEESVLNTNDGAATLVRIEIDLAPEFWFVKRIVSR